MGFCDNKAAGSGNHARPLGSGAGPSADVQGFHTDAPGRSSMATPEGSGAVEATPGVGASYWQDTAAPSNKGLKRVDELKPDTSNGGAAYVQLAEPNVHTLTPRANGDGHAELGANDKGTDQVNVNRTVALAKKRFFPGSGGRGDTGNQIR